MAFTAWKPAAMASRASESGKASLSIPNPLSDGVLRPGARDDPIYRVAQSFVNRECKYLKAKNFEFLVVDEVGQGISEKFDHEELCGTFKFVDGWKNKLLQRIS
jgi:hypothetical protein